MTMIILLKSRVSGYTKKDGTYVAEHQDKRQAKQKDLWAYPWLAKKKPQESPHKPHGESKFKGEGKPIVFGSSKPKEPPKPPKAYHPKKDHKGKDVGLYEPSEPTPLDNVEDPYMVATFTPGSEVPEELNGVSFEPWTDHPTTDEEWNEVEGQMELDEPIMMLPEHKTEASGVIIEEDDGRIWVIHPSNGFGGYKATFPKGGVEDEINPQANAIKEAFEESGLKVEITGYVGDVERSTSVARYYMARRVGGSPSDMGWESQAVSLVPRKELADFLDRTVDKKLTSMLKI